MKSLRTWLVPLAAGVLAVCLIVPTWSHLSFTFDEPAHLATGMELVDRGRYAYEPQHPPLSRVSVAAGPYLLGVRTSGEPSMWNEGRALLFDSARPIGTVLAWARAGTLLFVVLGVFVVWALGRWLWSAAVGGLAAVLLALQPVFLGHGGLATTDAAAASTLALAIWLLLRLIDRPSAGSAALAGCGVGLATGAKFTALLFLAALVPALAVAAAVRGRLIARVRGAERPVRTGAGMLAAGAGAALLTLWAIYGFSVGPILPPENMPFEGIDALVGPTGTLHDAAYGLATLPVPMPELAQGVAQAFRHAQGGHRAYFMGEIGWNGWPLFFPVALLSKTPIPFLLLVGAGYLSAARAGRTMDWRRLALLLAPAAMLAAVVNARVNIGLRHILGIYPLLAVIAGAGGIAIARSRLRGAGPAVVTVLVAWMAVSLARSFPDYVAYFSEPFEAAPQRLFVDSDLVWGQDWLRVRDLLAERNAETVHVATMGQTPSRRLEQLGLPAVRWLEPYEPVAGWVVADWFALMMGSSTDLRVPADAFRWLLAHEPVARIGAGTLVYHFDEPPDLEDAYAARRAEWRTGPAWREVQTPDAFAGEPDG